MTDREVLYFTRMALPGRADRLTADQCQQAIGQMEQTIPHDQLPEVYDYLITRRDCLREGRPVPVIEWPTWVHPATA